MADLILGLSSSHFLIHTPLSCNFEVPPTKEKIYLPASYLGKKKKKVKKLEHVN